MNQIMQGQPLTIFGDGSQTRAFTYIGDVAPIIACSVDVPAARNQVFNIGADMPYAVNDLAQAVMQAMGTQVPIQHLPTRHEVLHAYSDHSQVQRVFRQRPQTSLEEGLGRMAVWAKKVGARKSKRFSAVEIPKNLPAIWLQD
jgi:UDP-glucose 4-epimerase